MAPGPLSLSRGLCAKSPRHIPATRIYRLAGGSISGSGKRGLNERNQPILAACEKYGYVYLQAAPGCAAKLAQGIKGIQDVTWFEMGMPEALWDLEAVEFGPLVVGMDTHGNSIYKNLKEAAFKKLDEIYPA